MPKVFAFDTVSVLFISWTTTSCEEPASRLTSSIASLQIAQPANHLYRNNRDGTFTDVTAKANLVRSGWGQGVCVGDYNNDGVMDLFVTYYGKNVLYRNNGDGTFTVADDCGGEGQGQDREIVSLMNCAGNGRVPKHGSNGSQQEQTKRIFSSSPKTELRPDRMLPRAAYFRRSCYLRRSQVDVVERWLKARAHRHEETNQG